MIDKDGSGKAEGAAPCKREVFEEHRELQWKEWFQVKNVQDACIMEYFSNSDVRKWNFSFSSSG